MAKKTKEEVIQMWLEWFYSNAYFGTAHSDVMIEMFEDFQYETGEILPKEITEWDL